MWFRNTVRYVPGVNCTNIYSVCSIQNVSVWMLRKVALRFDHGDSPAVHCAEGKFLSCCSTCIFITHYIFMSYSYAFTFYHFIWSAPVWL